MGMLNWLLNRGQARGAQPETGRVNEMIERVVAVNPRLRMAQHCRERLASAVSHSIAYIDELIGSLPPPHEANAAAWSSDPCIRAFFATPDDVARVFNRSIELRAWIEQNPGLTEVYATLGMEMTERRSLGVALEGDAVRHDVLQTTLCFSDHQVRVCGRTETDLREEIKRRLIDQLALEGLAKLAADRHELMAKGQALLQTRLSLLERQGVGMRAVAGGGPKFEADQLDEVQAQIDENARELAAIRAPSNEINLELERVCNVLSDPSIYAYVTKKHIRIDLMNVVRDDECQGSREIEFNVARIPGKPPQTRAFALVRFPCAELLPAGIDFDAAARLL